MPIFQAFGRNNNPQNNEQNGASKINVRSVLRYTMMPEILPRIRALGMHFGHFAYLLAMVFGSAKLIPNTHPVMNAANIGQFGVRQVIALAANNIVWSRKNIDQIAIFSAIVIALIMIVIQAVLIALAALVGVDNPANAQGFFSPNDAAYDKQTDVALIFLSQVFGTDIGLFGVSTVNQTVPVQAALRHILGFYSMAMMVIALIIVIYYLMVVVAEAAKDGTPFGKRFNSLWAPIRLVIALGLLVPLGSGLNSAQYLTLWTAQLGSGLATNAWSQFARGMTETGSLISQPDVQTTTGLVQGIWAAEVCRAAYMQSNSGKNVEVMQVVNNKAYTVNWADVNSIVNAAKASGKIEFVWTNKANGENVKRTTRRLMDVGIRCGTFTFDLAEFAVYNEDGTIETSSGKKSWWTDIFGVGMGDKVGTISDDLRNTYLRQFKSIVDDLRPEAQKVSEFKITVNKSAHYGDHAVLNGIAETMDRVAKRTYNEVNAAILAAFEDISSKSGLQKDEAITEMVSKGWGAAGIWFANIGKINQHYQENANISFPVDGAVANIGNGDQGTILGYVVTGSAGISGVGQEIKQAMDFAYEQYGSNPFQGTVPEDTTPGLYQEIKFVSNDDYKDPKDAFARLISWVFGAEDIYVMRRNPDLDPMVRLMGAGSAMINSSVILLLASVAADSLGILGGAIVGATAPGIGPAIGAALAIMAPIAVAIALIGLTAGAILFYVIPLMPFVYFCFAVMGWVLEIFEAVVAMPLWALAHLKIDGDGMPGQAAVQGYHLIFMILLRPILIVFGLIGGYLLFGACVYYLTSLYDMAVSVTRGDILGHSSVGTIGMMAYTVLYAFLVYNLATMCFKMIDDVPKGILRWMGSGAQTFGDSRGDVLGGQTQAMFAAYGALQLSQGGLAKAKGSYQGRQGEKDGLIKGYKDYRSKGQGHDQAVKNVGVDLDSSFADKLKSSWHDS